MKPLLTLGALALATAGLAACSETSSPGAQAPQPAQPSMRTGSAEDERACLDAVAQQTGNSVTVLSSEFSQANTLVIVGVGPNRAPWRCLVSGGIVADVMSLTDEGAL